MKNALMFLLLCLVSLLALPEPSLASPGAEGGKFAAADTNKDGFLTPEEFAAAFPGLKPQAFGAIDANGDGRIFAEEWRAFSLGHGSEGAAMPGHQSRGMPPAGGAAEQNALPLLPIPRTAPAPENQGTAPLPLLSPPGK